MKKFNQARVNGGSNYDSLEHLHHSYLTRSMEKYIRHPQLKEERPAAGKGKRRASAGIRHSHIVKHGAVGIRLIVPETYLQMPGTWQQTLDGTPFAPPELKSRQETHDAFDKVQRKLYRVTDEGCLIPHYSWAMRSQGNIDKGYQLMMDAYYGWRPAGGGLGVAEATNRFGWSEVQQASHVCHCGPMCCRPDHVISEPRWRNLKRNYCGSNDGVCDCVQGLSEPWNRFRCRSVYRRRNLEDLSFLSDPEEIRRVLNNFNCPGFFETTPGQQAPAVPLAGRFVEGVHWEFISEEEVARFADSDALKLQSKRIRN